MIKPYVITRDLVKTYLSIGDTTYDTQVDLYIPNVTDDLTRDNGICNQDFLITGTADTDGTATLSNVSLTTDEWDSLYTGSCIYINGEDGVISSFDEDSSEITLVSALTKTATAKDLLIRNFPSGAKATVAKMIYYKIDNGSVSGGNGEEVASKSIGPVSVSFVNNSNASLDTFGYPSALTKSLKTIKRPRYI